MREVPKLPRRPEARAFSVEALLQLVQDGKLRVPEFQRPQRWRSTHVVSLFDSVWRGFPIGELLLARARVPAATLHFGPVSVAGGAMDDGLLIVDGQQRLTALAGALLHPEARPRGDIHAIWFDLEEEKFKRLERAEPPLHWIPLNVVGDSFKQLQWLNAWALQRERPDLVQRALSLGRAIREYPCSASIVEGSEDALRMIFQRVNTAGVAMLEEEVFAALHTGAGHPLTSACARLSELGFGPIDDKDVVAALKAVEDMDPRARFSQSETDLDVDPAAIERSETALRRVIAFLVGVAGIPHVQLLPYRLPLRLLARFFDRHPEPDVRTLGLLVRWLWRGALSGAHSDDGDVVVAKLQACIGPDAEAAVTTLLQTVPRTYDPPSLADRWNGRAARTRLCALAMFHRGPLDPDTSETLDLAALQELFADRDEIGDVFQSCGDASDKSIASRFLISSKAQLARLLAVDGLFSVDPEILASHGLDSASLSMLAQGMHAEFLRMRAAAFDPWMHQFFRERSAPDDSDRPSIATIVARTDAWTLRP